MTLSANEDLAKTGEDFSGLQITEPTSLNTDNVEPESEESDKDEGTVLSAISAQILFS